MRGVGEMYQKTGPPPIFILDHCHIIKVFCCNVFWKQQGIKQRTLTNSAVRRWPCSNIHNNWYEPLQQTKQVKKSFMLTKNYARQNKVSLRNLKMWIPADLNHGVRVQQEVSGEGNIWRSNLENLTKTFPFFISLSKKTVKSKRLIKIWLEHQLSSYLSEMNWIIPK